MADSVAHQPPQRETPVSLSGHQPARSPRAPGAADGGAGARGPALGTADRRWDRGRGAGAAGGGAGTRARRFCLPCPRAC